MSALWNKYLLSSVPFLAWLLAAALCAAPVCGQGVQLKDGTILLGEIVEPGDDGFTLKRLDNGGVLELRWSQLSPASSDRLKQIFRMSVDDAGEVLSSADVLEVRSPGGGSQTFVGRIVGENENEISLLVRGQVYRLARQSIIRRTTSTVPVLELQTRDEYYGEQLQALQPGDDADLHVQLADLMMRVRDYDRAEVHLNQAQALGGGRQPRELAGKIERLKLLQGAKAERDMLDEMATARNRREFAKAGALIAEFEKKYPQSRLKQELTLEKERYRRDRDRVLAKRVLDSWLRAVSDFSSRKATETGVTLSQARQFAEAELGKMVRAHVARLYELPPDEVDRFWSLRKDRDVVPTTSTRIERYAYGIGSWVLGADKVLKDTKQGSSEQKDPKQESAEEREFERLARRIAEARRRAQQAQGGQQQKAYTEEDWWRAAQPNERRLWIRAYYAEYGGDMEVLNAYVDPCVACGGEGRIEVIGDTGRPVKVNCATCQGTRFTRSFRAQ